jgi:hypothetical protein
VPVAVKKIDPGRRDDQTLSPPGAESKASDRTIENRFRSIEISRPTGFNSSRVRIVVKGQ